MGILNIKPAERSGSRVVIGISGQSGSGKTLTALKMARGMVNKPEEIGFLDSENGRGRLYSGELDGPFMHADLYAPLVQLVTARLSRNFRRQALRFWLLIQDRTNGKVKVDAMILQSNHYCRVRQWQTGNEPSLNIKNS